MHSYTIYPIAMQLWETFEYIPVEVLWMDLFCGSLKSRALRTLLNPILPVNMLLCRGMYIVGVNNRTINCRILYNV